MSRLDLLCKSPAWFESPADDYKLELYFTSPSLTSELPLKISN